MGAEGVICTGSTDGRANRSPRHTHSRRAKNDNLAERCYNAPRESFQQEEEVLRCLT